MKMDIKQEPVDIEADSEMRQDPDDFAIIKPTENVYIKQEFDASYSNDCTLESTSNHAEVKIKNENDLSAAVLDDETGFDSDESVLQIDSTKHPRQFGNPNDSGLIHETGLKTEIKNEIIDNVISEDSFRHELIIPDSVDEDRSAGAGPASNRFDCGDLFQYDKSTHQNSGECSQSANSESDSTPKCDKKRYICDVCPYESNDLTSIKRHRVIHTGKKPFKCELCAFACTRSDGLQNHIKMVHDGEKPYECDICQYKCATSSNLKDHKRVHSGEKPFECDVCSYRCTRSTSLKHHKMTHTGEKPYECDVCPFRSSSSGDLKRHKRTHSGEKPYECDICSHKSITSNELLKHKRVHTGEKPYKCDQCPYEAAFGHNLKDHKRTHSGEKPFACDLCPFKCATSSELKKHKMVHSGEKPFKCNICQFKCSRSQNLKIHKMIHSGEKPYKCEGCDFKTRFAASFRRHKLTHTVKQESK